MLGEWQQGTADLRACPSSRRETEASPHIITPRSRAMFPTAGPKAGGERRETFGAGMGAWGVAEGGRSLQGFGNGEGGRVVLHLPGGGVVLLWSPASLT